MQLFVNQISTRKDGWSTELIPDRYQYSYHWPPDVRETDLGFALSELQSADVLQSGSVFIHLFTDDQLHTAEAQINNVIYTDFESYIINMRKVDVLRSGLADVLYTL